MAEDLVQDVFGYFWIKRKEIEIEVNVKAFRIIREKTRGNLPLVLFPEAEADRQCSGALPPNMEQVLGYVLYKLKGEDIK